MGVPIQVMGMVKAGELVLDALSRADAAHRAVQGERSRTHGNSARKGGAVLSG